MRKKIFLNVLLILVILLSMNFNIHAGQKLSTKPIIKISPELWDFGTVIQGEEITHIFKVTNIGDDELIVNKVHTSCGCLVASISSKKIAPGKAAEVKVILYSKKYKGRLKKYIYIRTNDPDAPHKSVIITGRIKALPKVTISTQQLTWNFVEGQPHAFQFNIENKGNELLRILSIGTSSNLMNASISSAEIKPGESALVNMILKSTIDIEKIKEHIYLKIDIPITSGTTSGAKDGTGKSTRTDD